MLTLDDIIAKHPFARKEPTRSEMIQDVLDRHEAIRLQSGTLATWTEKNSTGRSPHDTYIVHHPESAPHIDWTSPNNHPMEETLFDALLQEAREAVRQAPRLYDITRTLGADSAYALPIRIVADRAISVLFADTMFRPTPRDIEKSIFFDKGFTLLVLPHEKIKAGKDIEGLRVVNGAQSEVAIVMDMDQRICLVLGSSYCGTVKKTMFTVMNYILPEHAILPLHSSAMVDEKGRVAVLLGLSGTGKTTLSNDERRLFIGDDEHGWSQEGIANFENGCYAKTIRLNKEREPEIYHALFDERPVKENGCILENAMVYPDGSYDLDDDRYTENSRGSFPISYLNRRKQDAKASHPSTILFLTADAHGVLPPIAKLTTEQALYWFLMGYTCKLAGTETGITQPVTTFSRFFGQPFMPRQPMDYLLLLEKYLHQYTPSVYLVNTGWSGGPYGVGKRMDIGLTRMLVDAALSGTLDSAAYKQDARFHVSVPVSIPGVDPTVLDPRATWTDQAQYDERADTLVREFRDHFEKSFAHSIRDERICSANPSTPSSVRLRQSVA
ncbi:phosphoenolpyruvate carboxykinase (ATP) [Candidatus Uhrbacteria bacterium]|nr:phosphoenolpyruvate carboxykinase (ATP) [Candidatus Uhrbacteria bacterium]